MSPPHTLLTLPGEIRNQIYSLCAPPKGVYLDEDIKQCITLYCLLNGFPEHPRCLWGKGKVDQPPKCRKFDAVVATLIEQETSAARTLMLVNRQISGEFLSWLYLKARWHMLAAREVREIEILPRLRHVTMTINVTSRMMSNVMGNMRRSAQIAQAMGREHVKRGHVPRELFWMRSNDKSLQSMTVLWATDPNPSTRWRQIFRGWMDIFVEDNPKGGQIKAWNQLEQAGSDENAHSHICFEVLYEDNKSKGGKQSLKEEAGNA